MSEMLRIEHAEVARWGRASGFELPLPSNGFVVLYGPNESGKTSLATALAWMIAGPGTTHLLHRFGQEDELLQASLRGWLGTERLVAEVDVKVPRRQSRATATETFNAAVGNTDLGRADLINRLGVGDFDSYRRFYWVGTLEVADGSDLQESVSVQAVFGGVNPFAKAADLATEAKNLLGSLRGRAAAGTARELQDRANAIERDLTRLKGARDERARLEDEIRDAAAGRSQGESILAKRRADLRSVELAIKAYAEGSVAARNDADRRLADTPEPSEAERHLHAETTLASKKIGKLSASESQVASKQREYRAAEDAVDLSWRPLIAGNEVGSRALEAALSAELSLKDLLSQVDISEADRYSADERRQAAEGRFHGLAEEWKRLSPKNLMPDDVPLPGDPQSRETDSGTRASRSTGTGWARTAPLAAAAACFIVLALIPETWEGLVGWLIAGLGVMALGVLAYWPRRLDPETVNLARRYQAARGDSRNAEQHLQDEQSKLDALRSRAEAAQRDYRKHLCDLRVPDDLIGQFEPDAVAHLRAVRDAQTAHTTLERARHEMREPRRAVIDLFASISAEGPAAAAPVAEPMSQAGEFHAGPAQPGGSESQITRAAMAAEAFDAARAETLLDAVAKKVRVRRAADEEARGADLALRSTVNYDEAALAHVENSTQDELQKRKAALIAEVTELEEELEDTKNQTVDLEADKRKLESPEKTTAELSLRRSALQARTERLMVRGLARHLAATLLRDTAERHRTEQQPELLRRTAELVCRAADWHGVAVNPRVQTDSESATAIENLLVDGPRGEHSDRQLSLGAQTLLYLTLRLATVERLAKSRGVRLPLILDDVLISLDDERAKHCLEILAEFSEHHQVILLTCHETTRHRAEAAGAAVLPVRGVERDG